MVLVDKPAGPSSFGVLRGLRPALGAKLGHAGTLDPFATGLLLVLAGRSTRLAQFLSGADKRYRAVIQLGARSSTLDPEGDIEPTGVRTAEADVRAAAASLVGEGLQQVPAASAVRIDGRRSYARMRSGETVTAAPRTVRIERLDVLHFDPSAQRAEIDVVCSKGTYVRQIAADIGTATGAGGYCLELRRTASGTFSVDDAGSPQQILAQPDGPWLRPPSEAVAHLPLRELTDQEAEYVRHGRALEPAGAGEGTTLRLQHGAELLAVGIVENDRLRPRVVLA